VNQKDLETYFSGKALYGDDFDHEKIKEWFEDEKEGYSQIIDEKYEYAEHGLNKLHGFSRIKEYSFDKVLLFGGASGFEILPIIDKVNEIFIADPSIKLRRDSLSGKKLNYVTPAIDSNLPFAGESFDLVTCFGVLHHIPNVSSTISELIRVLKPQGYLLLREPIISMGDWTGERRGLTKRERGIPVDLLNEIIVGEDLKIVYSKKVIFPVTRRISLNNVTIVLLDSILSTLSSWHYYYHPKNIFQKLQPGSIFYVLQKK
jgi:ubiquinone/menaquinone biosynthesis C-methylase UbiE